MFSNIEKLFTKKNEQKEVKFLLSIFLLTVIIVIYFLIINKENSLINFLKHFIFGMNISSIFLLLKACISNEFQFKKFKFLNEYLIYLIICIYFIIILEYYDDIVFKNQIYEIIVDLLGSFLIFYISKEINK